MFTSSVIGEFLNDVSFLLSQGLNHPVKGHLGHTLPLQLQRVKTRGAYSVTPVGQALEQAEGLHRHVREGSHQQAVGEDIVVASAEVGWVNCVDGAVATEVEAARPEFSH